MSQYPNQDPRQDKQNLRQQAASAPSKIGDAAALTETAFGSNASTGQSIQAIGQLSTMALGSGGNVMMGVFAFFFAPLTACMSLAHHCLYYDFGMKFRWPFRLMAVLAPVQLYIIDGYLRRNFDGTVFNFGTYALMVIMPLATIAGFIYYGFIRDQGKINDYSYGQFILKPLLPSQIRDNYYLVNIVAPSIPYGILTGIFITIFLGSGETAAGIGITVGFIATCTWFTLNSIGYAIYMKDQREERRADEAQKIETQIRSENLAGQTEAGTPEYAAVVPSDQPFVIEPQDQYIIEDAHEEPAEEEVYEPSQDHLRFSENEPMQIIAKIWDDFRNYLHEKESQGVDVSSKKYFRRRGFDTQTKHTHDFIFRGSYALDAMTDEDVHYLDFLGQYFTEDEIDYIAHADSRDDEAMFNAIHDKMTQMGAVSLEEIYT